MSSPKTTATTATTSSGIDKPIMGGKDNVDNDREMAWTGGKPKHDWTELAKATTQASKPTQYRAQGSAGVKSYTYRTEGLKHKFDKSGNLEVFCTNVWEHLQECDMDIIAYLPSSG